MVSLTIRLLDGSVITLEDVDPAMTVSDFKRLLGPRSAILPNVMRLVCRGRVFEDTDTLQTYELDEHSRIYLLRNHSCGISTIPQVVAPQSLPEGNAALLQNFMRSPLMQSVTDNPEVLQMVMNMNPQMRELREQNPELNQLLSDPAFLRQSMEAMSNPELMREMVRNSDRAMSNIEAIPGGFNALRRMHESIAEPMWNATVCGSVGVGNTNTTRTYAQSTTAGPNTSALPNPWAPPPPVVTPTQNEMMPPLISQQRNPPITGGSPIFQPFFNPFMFNPTRGSAPFPAIANIAQSEPQAGNNDTTSSNTDVNNATAQSDESLYAVQLEALGTMGFSDRQACIEALRSSNGNVNRALDNLLGTDPS